MVKLLVFMTLSIELSIWDRTMSHNVKRGSSDWEAASKHPISLLISCCSKNSLLLCTYMGLDACRAGNNNMRGSKFFSSYFINSPLPPDEMNSRMTVEYH